MGRPCLIGLAPPAMVLAGLFGALGLGVHAVAAVTGAYSLVNFDDRIKTVRPGETNPARVSDQYRQDLGVEFREDTVYDVGASLEGGLARSGTNVLACFPQVDSCAPQIGWSFDAPQGWIEVWVGFSGPHPNDIKLRLAGQDGQGNDVTGTDGTIPAGTDSTPVSIPIWAVTPDGNPTITQVSLQALDGTLGSVLIDDVAFAPTTPPPDLALTGATLTAADGSIAAVGTIVNVGPVPADPFAVHIDGPAGPTDLSFNGLVPGESVPLDTSIALPDGFGGPTAHVRIVVAPDLAIPDANPADNVFEEDVSLPPPPPSAAPPTDTPTVAPTVPPVPPTAAPTAPPGPPTSSADLFQTLLGLAVIAGLVLAVGAILKLRGLWPFHRDPPVVRTAEISAEATTDNGVKVTIDLDGETATATVEFDQVTITVDSGGSASLEVKDGPPPKSCPALRPGNLANGRCWYAQRQVTVTPSDGRVRAMTIGVEGGAGIGSSVAVPDDLVQRILQIDGARDRQAATAAVLSELSERATNLAGSIDGANRITIRGRVAWLKVPAQVTLYACLGTGADGAFKELKPIRHTFDVLRDRDLAWGPVPAGDEPGDAIRNVVAAAIDQARRPQRWL